MFFHKRYIWATAFVFLHVGSVCRARERVEAFKEFISNPPMIESIVWEVNSPSKGRGPQIYLGKWQQEAILIAKCEDAESALAGRIKLENGKAVGRFKANYWNYFVNELTLWVDSNSKAEAENTVYLTYVEARAYLAELMNLGVPHLSIGSVKWDGLSFNEVCDSKGSTVSGKILADAGGNVTGLDLEYKDINDKYALPRVFKWQLDYFYEDAGLEIPSRFALYLKDAGGKKQQRLAEHVIKHLKTRSAPGSFIEFDSRQYVPKGIDTYFIEGGDVKYKSLEGDIKTVAKVAPPAIEERRVHRYLYWTMVFVVLIAPLSIFLLRRENKIKP